MERTIAIWSNRKERNKDGNLGFMIETRIVLSQDDIEEIALIKYLEDYSTDDSREYKAELEETKH